MLHGSTHSAAFQGSRAPHCCLLKRLVGLSRCWLGVLVYLAPSHRPVTRLCTAQALQRWGHMMGFPIHLWKQPEKTSTELVPSARCSSSPTSGRSKPSVRSASRVLLGGSQGSLGAFQVLVQGCFPCSGLWHLSSSFYKSLGAGGQTVDPAHTKPVFSHLGGQQASVSFVMTSDLNRMT